MPAAPSTTSSPPGPAADRGYKLLDRGDLGLALEQRGLM
jgi:hypothetical protein